MLADCSLDPENHKLVLTDLKDTGLWVGTMENHESGCTHSVLARLICTSTCLPQACKEEIEKLRVRSKWLDHVCAFHGTESLIDYGTFLLMDEYKESLQTKLHRDKRLTSEEIQRYGSDIICGVGQLHHAGIVCADIEPSTVLLDEKDRAHISRYGATSTEKQLSVNDICIGHNYAAPETWKNGHLFSKASNAWSVGSTLLVMCSGMLLWDGLSEAKISEYVEQKILPLHLDGLEDPLCSIIHDCLQYEIEKRPTLNEIQEKFLCCRQLIHPLANSLRIRELPINDIESPSEDGGEDDSDRGSEDCSRESDVLLACEKGLLEDLQKLLEPGANLGDGGSLCLAVSLKKRHEKEGRPGKAIVESLLAHGMNPSCKDDLGQSPLHIAARMDDAELLDILIDAGADVNIRNIQNETPLHVALKNCAGVSCIDCLLQRRANHTLQDNDGNTAIHIAAQAAVSCKNLDALSMLLKLDASSAPPAVNAKNYRGYTLGDLLKRLPTNVVPEELKIILEKAGLDLLAKDDSSEGEQDQTDSGLHGKHNALHIDGLQDADLAGGSKSLECTLILTEGRTAKKFATSGRFLLGKDVYGSYTLRGKVINLKGKSKSKEENIHVKNIFAALGLGLQVGAKKVYVFDKKKLRYGHVLMMMDQDSDGNHIRGLLINMFHDSCPELLQMPLFLQDFRTYLFKVTNLETKETRSFRSLSDYQTWSGTSQGEWQPEYFKGIASNSDEEVKNYFTNIEDHIRYFVWHGVIDSNYIEKAFCNFNSEDRKKWILEHEDGLYNTSPNPSDRMIGYHEFIQKELVVYFVDAVKRQIPCMMDGLKRTQRKIMCTMLDTDAGSAEKVVSTLAGLVSEHTVYHHGPSSLNSTIIAMAQDFCGTNNLNLLKPKSLFGSRNEGSHVDSESAKYLKVEISPLAALIFRKEDNALLDRDREDGKVVQPKWYAPIFPLILVNGASGVAPGFSTSVLKYDVNTIIRNLERLMAGLPAEELIPSYRDFKGTVEKVEGKCDSYSISGTWDLDDNCTTLKIFELPVFMWYEKFEERLRHLKRENVIKSFEIIKKDPHGAAVHWYKILLAEALDKKTVESKFELKRIVSSHIKLYNAHGILRYYTSPNKVLYDFYIERLEIYEKRKDLLIKAGSIHSDVTAKDLWKRDLDDFKEAYNK